MSESLQEHSEHQDYERTDPISKSLPSLVLSQYLPQRLLPTPVYRRKVAFLKEAGEATLFNKVPSTIPSLSEDPVCRKERVTINNYPYKCQREFLENSTFHKQRMLGRKNSYGLRYRLPPLKESLQGLVTKRQEERQALAMSQSSMLHPNAKLNAFERLPKVERKNSRASHQSKGSGKGLNGKDARGTNTLMYSETYVNENESGKETVFKFVDKKKDVQDSDIIQINELQEGSPEHGQSVTKSHFVRSAETGNFASGQTNGETSIGLSKSEFIEGNANGGAITIKPTDLAIISNENAENEENSETMTPRALEAHFKARRSKIPLFNNQWFEYYDQNGYYYSVSSVSLNLDGKTVGLDFGLSQILLKSQQRLTKFLQEAKLEEDGTFSYSEALLERIEAEKATPEQAVTFSEIDCDQGYKKILITHSLVRVYSSKDKVWKQRWLNLTELEGIQKNLDFAFLKPNSFEEDYSLRDEPYFDESSPFEKMPHSKMSSSVPDQLVIKRDVEKAVLGEEAAEPTQPFENMPEHDSQKLEVLNMEVEDLAFQPAGPPGHKLFESNVEEEGNNQPELEVGEKEQVSCDGNLSDEEDVVKFEFRFSTWTSRVKVKETEERVKFVLK